VNFGPLTKKLYVCMLTHSAYGKAYEFGPREFAKRGILTP